MTAVCRTRLIFFSGHSAVSISSTVLTVAPKRDDARARHRHRRSRRYTAFIHSLSRAGTPPSRPKRRRTHELSSPRPWPRIPRTGEAPGTPGARDDHRSASRQSERPQFASRQRRRSTVQPHLSSLQTLRRRGRSTLA